MYVSAIGLFACVYMYVSAIGLFAFGDFVVAKSRCKIGDESVTSSQIYICVCVCKRSGRWLALYSRLF